MNINLCEYSKLVQYGDELCNMLVEKGYNAKLKPYTMYDGRKGLSIQLFDSLGGLFKIYYSGVSDYETMKNTMYVNTRRIINEC